MNLVAGNSLYFILKTGNKKREGSVYEVNEVNPWLFVLFWLDYTQWFSEVTP